MENRIAIVKNGLVDNVIVCSDEFAQNIQETTVNVTSIDCEIGYSYNGINFSAPVKSQEEINQEAKSWRNTELARTDFIVPLTDFPNHSAWLTYRQELRDWTTTEDFPNIKPTAPAEL